jgi:hypothetical protein
MIERTPSASASAVMPTSPRRLPATLRCTKVEQDTRVGSIAARVENESSFQPQSCKSSVSMVCVAHDAYENDKTLFLSLDTKRSLMAMRLIRVAPVGIRTSPPCSSSKCFNNASTFPRPRQSSARVVVDIVCLFFFFFTVNQEPFIVKLHDRMSKLDLRAKQPQLQI